MGNFFSSPKQRASESLYDAAVSGKPMGASFLNQSYLNELSSMRAQTSQRLGGEGGDILSRTTSAGFAPGSGIEGLISKNQQGVLASEQGAEAGLAANEQSQLLQLLLGQLQAGLSGLPASSPFGDILSTLSTLGNIGGGVGLLLRGINTPGGTPTNVSSAGYNYNKGF